jgi:GTPase
VSDQRGAFTDTLISREQREQIVLVGVTIPPLHDDDTDLSLDELALLIDTAGADTAARVLQRRRSPDPATYIGSGKAEELLDVCLQVDADTVVFDNELAPAQQFNLEKILGRTAIDRTAVILDIFAQNAHTLEGKAQVELALLRYQLPRLRRGRKAGLAQQKGGIGSRSRGQGETQIEVDRRRIQRRITALERDIAEMGRSRQLQRKQRRRGRQAQVSIVGYTNAGKSTLLNHLTDAGVLVEDRLFATLDPTTRRMSLPGGETVLLSDTVGFVRRLPHQLVEAFKSTLEVVTEADLLVHVVDITAPDLDGQIAAVDAVLAEIGAQSVPQLIVWNKVDLLATPEEAKAIVDRFPGSVAVSARTGDGVDSFLHALGDRLRALSAVVELFIPYARGDVLAALHREGAVVTTVDEDDGVRVRARLSEASQGALAEYVVAAL